MEIGKTFKKKHCFRVTSESRAKCFIGQVVCRAVDFGHTGRLAQHSGGDGYTAEEGALFHLTGDRNAAADREQTVKFVEV